MFWNVTIINQIFVGISLPPREDLWDRHICAWAGASNRNVLSTRAQCIGFTIKDAAQAESVSMHKVDTFQANPRLTPSSSLASRALCCRNWLKPAGPVWRGILPCVSKKGSLSVSRQGFYWLIIIRDLMLSSTPRNAFIPRASLRCINSSRCSLFVRSSSVSCLIPSFENN